MKGKRVIAGILLGICVTAASLYYFFQAEKKEAENRMVKKMCIRDRICDGLLGAES